MCDVVKEQLVITSEVKLLYESENRNAAIDDKMIKILQPNEEKFLNQLIDYVEQAWNKPNFNVNDFSRALGLSKSQLYRKLTKLTGQSPNSFLKEFRLNKALNLLHEQYGNISEIAFETGFNSAAYFSKCFLDKYGILPSKYIQQHIA
jgi:AraC-like DNA-binding protein